MKCMTVKELYTVLRQHMELGRHDLPVVAVDYKTGFAMETETAYDTEQECLFESSASAFLEPNDKYVSIFIDRRSIE